MNLTPITPVRPVNNPEPVTRDRQPNNGAIHVRYATSLQGGQYVMVHPDCWNPLGVLSSARVGLTADPSGGCQLVPQRELLAWIQTQWIHQTIGEDPESESTVVYPGLLPVVTKLLNDAGHQVSVDDRDVRPLRDAMPRRLYPNMRHDDHAIQFVAQNDRGLIRCGNGVNPALLSAQIASAYSTATIAIATARRIDAQRIGQELRRQGIDAANVGTQRDLDCRPRVVVGTYQAIMSCYCVDLAKRDVLIVTNAVESLGNIGQNMLGRAWQARIFGLLPIDKKLAPLDADQLRAFFGFAELDIPAHGYGRLPVDVVSCRLRLHPRSPLRAKPSEVVSQDVCQHPTRNRLIASVACRIQRGERDGLTGFPAVASAITNNKPQRVLVLVENLDHLLRIAAELPEWSLVAGKDGCTEGLHDQQLRILERRIEPQEVGERVITTIAGTERIDISKFDVVIRADGGAGGFLSLFNSIGNYSVRANSKGAYQIGRLLLVDFDDRHHPLLRKWSRRRQQEYVRNGWYAPGADPIEERINQFLADRPGS